MNDRDRIQFFADRPAVPSLLELIEQYRDLHLLGRSLAAADSMAEIERRLALVEQFKGTQASQIDRILKTGTDTGWRP